ncbi:MAG: DUF1549 domain-containing protein [Akkermansiaceae bacterium]|nr:DUF1549 domain-containing protein [Akkermansiaceae bacterium]
MRIATTLLIFVTAFIGSAPNSLAEKFQFEGFKKRLPWIWEQPQRSLPPDFNPDSALDPVDAWLLTKLEAEKLSPAPPATDRLWLRRAHFAITGLPPRITMPSTSEPRKSSTTPLNPSARNNGSGTEYIHSRKVTN